jgi:membrane fusion protein
VPSPPARPREDTHSGRQLVPAGDSLFRSEVVAEQQSQWLGTVLLVPKISHAATATFGLLIAAGLLAILFVANYTRAARINGWLTPETGVIQIFAPQSGVLARLQVQEGESVKKGTPLALLSTELNSEALGETRKAVVRQLQARRESLLAGKKTEDEVEAHQKAELSTRVEALKQEMATLDRDFQLQGARMSLAGQAADLQRQLFAKRLAAITQLQQAEEDVINQNLTMQALKRQRTSMQLEAMGLEAQLWELPFKSQQQQAEIDRSIAALDQQIAEAEAQREIVVSAPEDGVVTAIQTESGGGVNTNVPLLSIIPSGSQLKAQLFAPSRVVGFLRPGQRVLLRYEAFPYQKFGHYEGTVTNVSRSATSPSLLSQQVSGLTSLFGSNAPVYEINVALARQSVMAYGKPVPLQPGMQLEADVLIEKRRLIEWVLDPIFTLTGKWHW